MHDWIDYYDSDHTIYVNARHCEVHFAAVAQDIIGLISSSDAVVLDYACGEALAAGKVASACAKLILAEPAPSVRERLTKRFAANSKIRVCALHDLRDGPAASVDLAVKNSVSQYMTPEQTDDAFAILHRLLKPDGKLVVGDVLRPDVGPISDSVALLKFGARSGFLVAAFSGLLRTALSDYRKLRSRVGLQTYTEPQMLAKLAAAGFVATHEAVNLGHNPRRMTFVAHVMAR